MSFIFRVFEESWHLFTDAAVYILFGLLVGGLLKVFLNPAYVAAHLGRGRFLPVLKAALFGIPIPLCSCGVLPAAASLKRQGANNGATTAFLISTPESGVDSIVISYALLDPLLTVARPLAALFTAVAAGFAENLLHKQDETDWLRGVDRSCPVDNCCDGTDCPPAAHASHHSFVEKLTAGLRFAFNDLWAELAGWFFAGLLLAGVIAVLVPSDLLGRYLGGGLSSMLIMLAAGIPMYICATASTPVAAALILKGVSPGAALVFLLAGPATNIASLSMLVGLLGRRATMVYLVMLAICTVLSGLVLDQVYAGLGLSAQAAVGAAAEMVPDWLQTAAALLLLVLSVKPLLGVFRRYFRGTPAGPETCQSSCCSPQPLSLQPAPPSEKTECRSPS